MYAAGAQHADCLQVLRSHHGAAARRVRNRIHDDGHGNQVFTRLAYCSNYRLRPHLPRDFVGGAPYALSPDSPCVHDDGLAVCNPKPDRMIGTAFNDYGVKTGVFHFRGKMAAHVPGPDEMPGPAGGPESRYGGPSVAWRAGACQRTGCKNDLVFRVEDFCVRRDLIPEDLVP